MTSADEKALCFQTDPCIHKHAFCYCWFSFVVWRTLKLLMCDSCQQCKRKYCATFCRNESYILDSFIICVFKIVYTFIEPFQLVGLRVWVPYIQHNVIINIRKVTICHFLNPDFIVLSICATGEYTIGQMLC